MNKTGNRKKRGGLLLAFAIVLSLAAGMLIPGNLRASESYDKDKTGSITINLTDLGTEMGNVQLLLYKVADAGTSNNNLIFELDDALSSTGVDVNDITTGEKNLSAAETLSDAIASSGITPASAVTDSNGTATFSALEQGMYLLVQTGTSGYGVISPLLIAVPYMTDGENWIYDVEASPKAEKIESTSGQIEVTKKLIYSDSDGNLHNMRAGDATYYVGLFCDAAGTIPFSSDYVKTLHFQASSSETATYADLSEGTYYIFETDKDGNPIALNETQKDVAGYEYKCIVGDGTSESGSNKVELQVSEKGNLTLSNVYYEIPDDYLLEGELSIIKKVVENGKETTTDDVFYASIYKKTSDTESELVETVQLTQNGTVTVALPLDGDGTTPTVFYVEETDSEGNALDRDSFDYTISGEGNVSLSADQDTGSITLTNTIEDEESGTEEEEGEESTEEEGTTTSTKKNGTKKKSTSSKTGDTTPIAMWIGVAVAAVLLIVVVMIRRRKDEK